MSSTYKTLTAIVAWTCLVFGLISVIGPTVVGIVTGQLVGTINDLDSGLLWFYRHGVSWIIGVVLFAVFLYAVKVRQSLE